MTAIIDTSSLMAIARYYLPFDQNNNLKSLLQSHFDNDSFVVIDQVFSESRFQAKGIIINELDFISKASKKIINTEEVLPNRAFFNMLENQFCDKDILRLRNLSPAEFESEKNRYLQGADAKIILYAQKLIRQGNLIPDKVIVVTEESATGNDGKLFRKIPAICGQLNIECCTLPVLFKDHYEIKFSELLI